MGEIGCVLGLATFVSEADCFLWREINDNESIRTSLIRILDSLLFAISEKGVVITCSHSLVQDNPRTRDNG